MLVIAYIVNAAISFVIWVVIASVVISWLVAFGVINRHNQFVGMIIHFVHALTEPLLRPIRRVVPLIGGTVDISPIILIVGLNALSIGLNNYVFLPLRG